MPVSVTVEPLIPSIDMYDSPTTSSAYSLSGHITIAASSSSSILGLSLSSAHNLILSSLELTFEGQSELLLTDVGYAPLRIISITKQLVTPSHPVQIIADEDRAEWRILFNLTIPGWLPATSVLGDDDHRDAAGVSYALYARALFQPVGAVLDDALSPSSSGTSTSSMWSNLCAVVRPGAGRSRAVQAEKVSIRVARYTSPPRQAYIADGVSSPVFPRVTFAVQALSECTLDESPATNIPPEILRSVELHTVVPSRTSVDDDSVPLVLRLRCCSDDEEARGRLRVLGFEANIIQVEKFHTSPSHKYTSRFPIPPSAQQPPHKPLISPHSVGTLFDLGLIALPPLDKHVVNERSIVPDGKSKHFKVRGDEHPGNNGVLIGDGWLRMEVDVPVSPGIQEANDREKGKRVAGTSPFLDVKHEMRVRLTVGYEQSGCHDSGEGMVSDELAFMVPLEFVLVTPTIVTPHASAFFPILSHMQHSTSSLPIPHPPMTPSYSSTNSLSRTRSLSSLSFTDASRPTTPFPSSLPPPPLPAYNQLFHENGDLKEDIHTALPLYHEKEEDAHSLSQSNSQLHSPSPSPAPQHPSRTLSSSSSSTRSSSLSPQTPRRALSTSSNSSRSSSSLSSTATSSMEHIGASGIFMTPLYMSMPPSPRLERFESLPESPISLGTPLTPPGLAGCDTPAPAQVKRQGKDKNLGRKQANSKGKQRENIFEDSFLRFDEGEEDLEGDRLHESEHQLIDEHVFEDGDIASVREVQYGIAL